MTEQPASPTGPQPVYTPPPDPDEQQRQAAYADEPETGPTAPAPGGPVSDPAPEDAPETATAPDEPTTVAPVPPEVQTTIAPPSETGVVTAANMHPNVFVKLRDVIAFVENFLARNSHLRAHESDLKSGLAAIERHNGPANTTAGVSEPAE